MRTKFQDRTGGSIGYETPIGHIDITSSDDLFEVDIEQITGKRLGIHATATWLTENAKTFALKSFGGFLDKHRVAIEKCGRKAIPESGTICINCADGFVKVSSKFIVHSLKIGGKEVA